jgi:organic radical activating enzyme
MKKIFNNANRFIIDWTLNSLCTYHCSYCPPLLHRGNNEIYDKDTDKEIVINFLNKLYQQVKDKNVHMFINGGEPTISHNLEPILDFCHEHGWCTYLSTNCSRSLNWWEQYASKIFKVTVSYHPEFVTDDIYEKMAYIGTQTNIGVFTLMYPPLWDKSVNAYNRFQKIENVTLSASRVFKRDTNDFSDSYTYSPEQLKWLEENSHVRYSSTHFPPINDNTFGQTFIDINGVSESLNEVEYVNNRKNSFIGWECNMGVDHISIDPFGFIKQSACKQAKTISALKDFTKLPTNSDKCQTEWCMCTSDVMIPKWTT